MKNISIVLIAIFTLGIFSGCFKNQSGTKNIIVIQSADISITALSLSQSAKIISDRLTDFSSGKFELTIIPQKNQIKVIFTDDWDMKTVENLLVQPGAFAFYATYTHDSLSELLKGDNHIFSLLKVNNADHSSARIGHTAVKRVEKVNEYLSTLTLNQLCKFVWSKPSGNSKVYLYALRFDNAKGALLTGSDIESFNVSQDEESKSYDVAIELKKSSVGLWYDATKRNINNSIAIVLDNQVIYAPTLKAEIDDGKCSITGVFSQTEARYFAALGNNGELPTGFNVVRSSESR